MQKLACPPESWEEMKEALCQISGKSGGPAHGKKAAQGGKMLRNINALTGHRIQASDGDLGRVAEFYFDDQTWNVRYMVAETGNWLSGRKVLIAPAALKAPDWNAKTLPVSLTREQVRNSPDIDTEKTVTRRHELELLEHYAWPIYWGESFLAGSMSGGALFPQAGGEKRGEAEEDRKERGLEDAHLQGTRAVKGYRLHAVDGLIGHVEDYIVDDKRWAIRFLVADTGTWLPGRRVLISPRSIERVDWASSEVFVDLNRDAIRSAPKFDPSRPVGEAYAGELDSYYTRHAETGAGSPGRGGRKR